MALPQNEPGFDGIWHLNEDSPFDVNIETAWARYSGDGVQIGILDDGFDLADTDLSGHRDDLAYNTMDGTRDVGGSINGHGTSVANILVGAVNGEGTVGVAYGADWAGYKVDWVADQGFQTGFSDALMASDVFSNSWHFTTPFSDNLNDHYFQDRYFGPLEEALEHGRDGLGTVTIFAAGNGRQTGDPASAHGMQNHIGTISVGSITKQGDHAATSSPGSSLLVSAPGDRVVTDVHPDYYELGSGTSFATPVVSGVTALMLEANPDLGWRDVQEIIAITANTPYQEGSAHPGEGWSENGSSSWNNGGFQFSNDFGFGTIDATAATNLARQWIWQSVSDNQEHTSASGSVGLNVAPGTTREVEIEIHDAIDMDQARLDLGWSSGEVGDMHLELVSPDGTVSTLLDRADQTSDDLSDFGFSSNAFWGEDAAGTWTLRMTNDAGAATFEARNFELSVFGDRRGSGTGKDEFDDTFYFTDQLSELHDHPLDAGSGRFSVRDEDGGIDTFNTAAIGKPVDVDLDPASYSLIDDVDITITDGCIEHAITGAGDDTVSGNDFANGLFTGEGDDIVSGGYGADHIRAQAGDDFALGGVGRDRLYGGSGQDTLEGGADRDRLFGGVGNDLMRGGTGNDYYYVGDAGDVVEEDLAEGQDTVFVHDANFHYHMTSGVEVMRVQGQGSEVSGTDRDDSIYVETENGITARGGAGDDRMFGLTDGHAIEGGTGDDLVVGGDGDQVLRGGDGSDRIMGLDGRDELAGGEGVDTFVFHAEFFEDRDAVLDWRNGEDRIDLSDIWTDYGLSANNDLALGDGYVRVADAGEHSDLIFNETGGADGSKDASIARFYDIGLELSETDFILA